MKTTVISLLLLLPAIAMADIGMSVQGGRSGLTSNSVIDIDHDSLSIWLGTGGGASVTSDGGSTWTTYGQDPLPRDEVSALTANDRGVWVANSHSESSAGESYPYGDGISVTRDGGQTWQTYFPEQMHFFGKLSYDLTLYDTLAYSACFYGGLVRSTDFGQSWQRLFPSQRDSINADSIDYHSESYQRFSNRFFSVKADTFGFPDTLAVWGGSAAGIYKFMFYADSNHVFPTYPSAITRHYYAAADSYSDDFAVNMANWTFFGDPTPMRDTTIHGRQGIFDNNGDSTCNNGALSDVLVGTPMGFSFESDIYLELIDTLGCWAEAGIGLTRKVDPDYRTNDCSDSLSTYGIKYSLTYAGSGCSDIPPERRRHAWFNAAFFTENNNYETFDPYANGNADTYLNGWHTLRVKILADRLVRFYIDDIPVWTSTQRLHPLLMTGRNLVLGFRSSGLAGKAYHDLVRYDPLQDSLRLTGNHVVALGVNEYNGAKTIWAACRPVNPGEDRGVSFSTDDGLTWARANIADASGDNFVEAWDFAFEADTVYVATGFGLFRSWGDYSTWNQLTGFVDPERQTFYQEDASFYCVDIVNGQIWAGGGDGVVKALPGDGWDVFRSSQNAAGHYAYPSPFSPNLSTRHGATIHFRPAANTNVTIRIYDFNLDLVKTVAENKPRLGGVESDDIIWDGTNDKGATVANGIYFYRIELASGDDLWGKVVVLK